MDGNRQDQKRGYLNQAFKVFHIKDRSEQRYEYHYHEFHKVILFLSGNVTYIVEGRTFYLKPWDILLVRKYDIHRPVISGNEVYERVVLWVSSEYLAQFGTQEYDLESCFEESRGHKFNLLELPGEQQEKIRQTIGDLEKAVKGKLPGDELLSNSLMLQFMVYLNRYVCGTAGDRSDERIRFDPRIEELLTYINSHITDELNVDALAGRIFVSRYYLMHKFKEETGYTIYNYIIQKRLIRSKELLSEGKTAAEAAIECGFKDYTAFLRAFKKEFGVTPREFVTRRKPTGYEIKDQRAYFDS